MAGTGTYMDQILPANIWDALLGANSPGSGNVFATMADLPAPAITIYTGDGSTPAVTRTVTLGGDLLFLLDPLGANGFFQIVHGGALLFQSVDVGDFISYFPGIADYLAVNTENLPSIGFRATHTIGATVDSFIEIVASDDSKAFVNISSDTTHLDFWVNSKLTYAGGILGATGAWGIGGLADNATSLFVTGKGNTTATNSQRWARLSGAEVARMTDNGVLCIGTTTPSSYLGTAQKLHIDSTVSSDYSPSVIINQSYSQVANNTNTSSTLFTNLYKASAFNTLEMFGAVNGMRNDGSGNISTMAAHQAFLWNTSTGTGNYNEAFAYNARTQTQQGNFTVLGGIVIQQQELLNTTVNSLIGVYVKSPVNVGGGNNVTNTYGVYLAGNGIGVNNYAYVSVGKATTGLGIGTPNQQAMLHIVANHDPVFKAHVYYEPITALQASSIIPSNGMGVYVSDINATFTTPGFWKYENGAWVTW